MAKLYAGPKRDHWRKLYRLGRYLLCRIDEFCTHCMKRLCMGINIGRSCIWAHQRHVVEWRDQEAIIQHSQVDVLL